MNFVLNFSFAPNILLKDDDQAGAELCQAQVKLGLAMLELFSTKLR